MREMLMLKHDHPASQETQTSSSTQIAHPVEWSGEMHLAQPDHLWAFLTVHALQDAEMRNDLAGLLDSLTVLLYSP